MPHNSDYTNEFSPATAGASSWSVTVQAATLGLQFIATGSAAACRWNGAVKTIETYGA